VRVSDGQGNPVTQFDHDFEELAPGASLAFEDTWNTAGDAEGRYFFTAGAVFNGAAAGPVVRSASTTLAGYLPLTMRQ